jgi:hypothetical protein
MVGFGKSNRGNGLSGQVKLGNRTFSNTHAGYAIQELNLAYENIGKFHKRGINSYYQYPCNIEQFYGLRARTGVDSIGVLNLPISEWTILSMLGKSASIGGPGQYKSGYSSGPYAQGSTIEPMGHVGYGPDIVIKHTANPNTIASNKCFRCYNMKCIGSCNFNKIFWDGINCEGGNNLFDNISKGTYRWTLSSGSGTSNSHTVQMSGRPPGTFCPQYKCGNGCNASVVGADGVFCNSAGGCGCNLDCTKSYTIAAS